MTQTAEELGLGGLYPAGFDEFVGQDEAKEHLLVACESARLRKVRLPHVLLSSGEPGIGKTTLALLCAQAMGSNIKIVSGKVNVNQARLLLSDLDDGDILVYDEVHLAVAGGKTAAEGWMLHLLENGVIPGPLGMEEQPDVTIVAATTDPGRLPSTLLDRFPIKPALRAYTQAEAADIAFGMAQRIFADNNLPLPTAGNFDMIADAACNNPRVMRGILEAVRDRAIVGRGEFSTSTGYPIKAALDWLGLTEDGLTRTCQRYLVALLRDFQGGAGERALVDRLGEPGGLGHTERILQNKGLIAKTKAGRVLMQPGIRRAKELAKEGIN